MQIKFVKGHKPTGQAKNIPDYKVGDVVSFDGPVAETYALKYIRRGFAVAHVNEPKAVKVDSAASFRPESGVVSGDAQVDAGKDFRKPRGRTV